MRISDYYSYRLVQKAGMGYFRTMMNCHPGCHACCIAISISSPIPGMPRGKRGGERCLQLDSHGLCAIYTDSRRPRACADFSPTREFCGENPAQALVLLSELERLTS